MECESEREARRNEEGRRVTWGRRHEGGWKREHRERERDAALARKTQAPSWKEGRNEERLSGGSRKTARGHQRGKGRDTERKRESSSSLEKRERDDFNVRKSERDRDRDGGKWQCQP